MDCIFLEFLFTTAQAVNWVNWQAVNWVNWQAVNWVNRQTIAFCDNLRD